MHVHVYRSLPYKAVAIASHIADRDVWPFYTDRLGRRITGHKLHFFSKEESEDAYGGDAYDMATAFHLLGLNIPIRDPRTEHPHLFKQAAAQIERLDIPFQQLGIAGSSDLRLAYSAATGMAVRDILETGVALGWSSLAFLAALRPTNGRLVSVDRPYPLLIGTSWVGAAVPSELSDRWTLLRHADRRGIPRALRLSNSYDLIHYDSDKTEEGRNWAYPLLWNGLRPGGLMISDDVGDNDSWLHFCKSAGLPLIVVRRERAFSGLARKPFKTRNRGEKKA